MARFRALASTSVCLALLAGCGDDKPSTTATTASTTATAPAPPPPQEQRPIIGMGDQGTGFFANPDYVRLGLRHVRLIASYDTTMVDFDRELADAWLAEAARTKAEPLVAFGHSRKEGRQRHLPSVAEFRRAFRAFHARYPQVRLYTAWNEPNNQSQPTDKHPERAAQYANALAEECPDCRLIAGDLLDEPDAAQWARSYRKALTATPHAWAVHDYSATNRQKPERLDPLLEVFDDAPVWLTETGGVARFGRAFPFDLDRQAQAFPYLFKLARDREQIERVYLYNWTGAAPDATFDAGLTNEDGTLRPAYDVVRRELGR